MITDQRAKLGILHSATFVFLFMQIYRSYNASSKRKEKIKKKYIIFVFLIVHIKGVYLYYVHFTW